MGIDVTHLENGTYYQHHNTFHYCRNPGYRSRNFILDCLYFHQTGTRVPPDLLKLFFASMLGVLFNQGLFTIGLGMTSPVDASIITTSTPILTMIIAAIYLKEPITSKKVSGIFLGASGALLLIVSNQNTGGATHNSNIWGDIVCLTAELSFALYLDSVQTTHQSLHSYHTHEMDVHLCGNMYHSIFFSRHNTSGMVVT